MKTNKQKTLNEGGKFELQIANSSRSNCFNNCTTAIYISVPPNKLSVSVPSTNYCCHNEKVNYEEGDIC